MMPKHDYDSHNTLHRCQKMSGDNMVMYTGNGDIKVHFWIVIPLHFHQVTIQLQLLACNTEARV